MDELIKIFAVAVGGAGGAVLRHLFNISPLAKVFEWFPLPTFVINVVGSFLIGFLLVLFADRFVVSENIRLAVIVGFLGAFTTFSTFEMEIFNLVRERHFVTGIAYLMLSIVVGLAGVMAGVALGKRV